MGWLELVLPDVPRGSLPAVSAALFANGASGLQEDQPVERRPPPRQPWDRGPRTKPPSTVLVRAWFEAPDRLAVANALGDIVPGCSPAWVVVADTDWETAWREGFEPLQIGDLVITPPWHPIEGAIVIEPGQGFGTGKHETTRAALTALSGRVKTGTTVLDVGCGSGILALAAAHAGAVAEGIDIDPASVEEAARHAELNGLAATFSTTPVDQIREPRAVVLANLYAELLVQLAPELLRLTGHTLILAGILADREQIVRDVFSNLTLESRTVDGEWVCLVYHR